MGCSVVSGRGGFVCPRLMTGMWGGRGQEEEEEEGGSGRRGAGSSGGGEDRVPLLGAERELILCPCLSSVLASMTASSGPVSVCRVFGSSSVEARPRSCVSSRGCGLTGSVRVEGSLWDGLSPPEP